MVHSDSKSLRWQAMVNALKLFIAGKLTAKKDVTITRNVLNFA